MRKNHKDSSGKNSPNIIKKEIILRVVQMLENGMNVMAIARELKIGRSIVSKVKNGGYNSIYNLPDIEWNLVYENMIKKEIILKIIDMLDGGFTQKKYCQQTEHLYKNNL